MATEGFRLIKAKSTSDESSKSVEVNRVPVDKEDTWFSDLEKKAQKKQKQKIEYEHFNFAAARKRSEQNKREAGRELFRF